MRRFLSGDERAFDVLYDRYSPRMYQFALRMMRGHERDAEDVLQEAWMRAAEGLNGFAWNSCLGTWLVGVTLNCAREALRHQARLDLQSQPRGAVEARGCVRPDVGDPDLEYALAALSDDFRLVLLLHDLEGYTHEEIAARLGISEGTSKSRLSRARHRLRTNLTSREGLHGESREEMEC